MQAASDALAPRMGRAGVAADGTNRTVATVQKFAHLRKSGGKKRSKM